MDWDNLRYFLELARSGTLPPRDDKTGDGATGWLCEDAARSRDGLGQ